jgi:hypothetical protein|tara:strand:+ start:623 stop:733 length:111 start_codon:yes stop_codon:yes gene_type:complete
VLLKRDFLEALASSYLEVNNFKFEISFTVQTSKNLE